MLTAKERRKMEKSSWMVYWKYNISCVTRFGEYEVFGNFVRADLVFVTILNQLWQKNFCHRPNFHYCKRPNIEQIIWPSGHTGHIVVIPNTVTWSTQRRRQEWMGQVILKVSRVDSGRFVQFDCRCQHLFVSCWELNNFPLGSEQKITDAPCPINWVLNKVT